MLTTYYRCPLRLEYSSQYDGRLIEISCDEYRIQEINDAIAHDEFFSANQAEYVCDWDDRAVLQDVRFFVTESNGIGYGIARVQTTVPLTPKEESMLIDEITGQFSDGWGESFEQMEIRSRHRPYIEYYASFWSYGRGWELKRIEGSQPSLFD